MTLERELRFESQSFAQRVKGMLGVDFYRLFHTPLYYIFLAIAAMIPAMVLSGGSSEGATVLYTNTWQMIASENPMYAVSGMGEYANMNMVFIFGGIMVSIFIGHDYRSGYVKQLFTTHPKKLDYMLSKTISCAFAMTCMCVTYLAGTVFSGMFTGTPFRANIGSLLIAILGKMVMSLGWAGLYTFLNVIFRRYFGISIASSFFFGTGILIILLGSSFGNSSLLNVFLYGASVYACLNSTPLTLLVCISVSVAWAVVYILLGTLILSRSDVY